MKSFKQALRQRVKKSKKIKLDDKSIEVAARKAIKNFFGNFGLENIKIESDKSGALCFFSERSVWRAELFLRKNFLKEEIEKIINRQNEIKIKIH